MFFKGKEKCERQRFSIFFSPPCLKVFCLSKLSHKRKEHYKLSCLVSGITCVLCSIILSRCASGSLHIFCSALILLSSMVCYSLCYMLRPFRMFFLTLPVSLLSDVLSIAKTRGVCICSDNSRLNSSKIPYPYGNMKAVINLPLEICAWNSMKRKLAECHLRTEHLSQPQ